MSTIIYEGIDMFSEAIALLEYMASDARLMDDKEKITLQCGFSPELLEEPFRVSAELLYEVKQRLQTKMPLVKEYFSYYKENGQLSKGAVTLLTQHNDYAKPLYKHRESALEMSEERRCYQFCQLIGGDYSTALSMNREDYRTLQDLQRCLDKSDYTPEQKQQLQWVFTHPKEAWEDVEPLVRTAMEVLEEKAALWRPLVKEFCDYYRQKLAEQSFEEYIMSELGFDIGENPKGRVLMSGIVASNAVSFCESSLQIEENGELLPDVCCIGIAVKRIGLNHFRNNPVDQKKRLAALLKALGDERRLEILALLKERRHSGSELAKELSLTTVTISQHIDAMLGFGLITLSKEMNQIYYEIDENAIRKILEQTWELLLGDSPKTDH
ncbi:MAG: winged helix-turn-helix transcriptional regulator [Acetatifactor sp.]|nr:winged helix-turn-helix transcriptional regulator [Acetatifactor sp.]